MHFGSQEEELAMKRYIISLLIKQAQSDGDFTNLEKKYLVYAATSLHLSDAELAAIRRAPENYAIAPPPDESKRMTILYYLLFMMKADQKVELEEEVLCHQVGFQMGFRQEMISDLIQLMKQYLLEDIPPNGMLEKVKPYLN
ncbi:MAG: hypothetical protein R2788_06790 [Saprospiraceae bacterium]